MSHAFAKVAPGLPPCLESTGLFHRARRLCKVDLCSLFSSLLLLTVLLLYGPAQVAAASMFPVPAPPLQSEEMRAPDAGSSYWIWMVLPRLFPEYLPDSGGYLSLGFPWQPGKETPTGIRKISAGVLGESRQHLDCLACHEATAPPPSSAVDRQSLPTESPYVKAAFRHAGYAAFLRRCAEDPRFEPDYLLPAIRYNHRVGWPAEWYYRWILIPEARRSFRALSG